MRPEGDGWMERKRMIRVVMCYALIAMMFSMAIPSDLAAEAIGEVTRITTDSSPQVNPDVYGSRIVWRDFRNGGCDLYMYDLSTGTESVIASGIYNVREPKVYGDRIVWRDYRDGSWDIYLYDLSTSSETLLSSETYYNMAPDIYDDIVVWMGSENNNYDIYMYDLSTTTTTQITSNTGAQRYPAIHGDIIVWQDSRNGDSDIYMYDLSTGTESQITSGSAIEFYPAIYDDTIVWVEADISNNEFTVVMYDMDTGTTTDIGTYGGRGYEHVKIFEDLIVWPVYRGTYWNILLYDASTGTECFVTDATYTQQSPSIQGDVIVWQETSNGHNWDVYMCDLNDPPVAEAGPDQTAFEGKQVSFDGTGSSDPDGTIVTYDWDFCDGSAHGSGSTPTHSYSTYGTYTVTLTVEDDDGSTDTDTMSVTVMTVSQAIDILIDLVKDLNLDNGIDNSLDVKLENAKAALDYMKNKQGVSAKNKLEAFINGVRAQSGNKIPTDDASVLVDFAQWIVDNM